MGKVKDGWRYFAEHANHIPKAREMMNGWNRIVQFSLDGEDPFYLDFSGAAVMLHDGTHGKPDLTLKGTNEIFYKLMTGKLDRMKAILLRQISFHGSVKDAVRFADIGDEVRRSVKFPP